MHATLSVKSRLRSGFSTLHYVGFHTVNQTKFTFLEKLPPLTFTILLCSYEASDMNLV